MIKEPDDKDGTMSTQPAARSHGVRSTPRGQAKAPETQLFGPEAFGPSDQTVLRWLGMAGFLINSRGTTIMIDPLLGWFDMPIMIDFPVRASEVPHLDAVLVTHSDNDHYSVPTCTELARVTTAYHSTGYVASLMVEDGLPAHPHAIGEEFNLGGLDVTLTPADHAWQNEVPGASEHVFAPEDACGFWIQTPDGTVWAPGDSRLIPEHHLQRPTPDAMLFDFSDSEWHFGLDGAVRMANAYPDTPQLLQHWGSVDSPDFPPFNADPASLYDRVTNPARVRVLAPGEPFTLERLQPQRSASRTD
jgi:L-ascorbate metabolism protein UlaG (beta-lactamase superfamily)